MNNGCFLLKIEKYLLRGLERVGNMRILQSHKIQSVYNEILQLECHCDDLVSGYTDLMFLVQKNLHLGIYGLLQKEDTILLVRKSRGPYKGLLDLPGGRIHQGENLWETLTRELQEETGIKARNYTFLGNFSFLISYRDSDSLQKELHHIALIYYVIDFDSKEFNPSITEEDVHGSFWINQYNIDKKDCSPLVNEALKKYDT